MPIFENKEIFDISKGNPLQPLVDILDTLDEKVDKVKKSISGLEVVLSNVNKTGNGQEAKALTENMVKLTKETEKLTALEKVQLQLKNQLDKANQQLLGVYTNEHTKLSEVKLETQRLNKAKQDAIKLQSKIVGAYEKESITLNNLRKKYKDLAVQNKANTAEGKKLLANIQQLDQKLKAIDKSVGQLNRSAFEYERALKNLGNELIGAAGITIGIAGVIRGFENFIERAKELTKINYQISSSFNISTDAAKELTSQVKALSETFDVDYKEVLTAANTVSKSFGIIGSEALNLIEQGFKKGSNNTGEFLSILREYPTQFKAAGLDAKAMFAIINQQVKQGIYSDKGVDAIKEGGLRLRENTKAVRDALKPLDESVKAQIKQEIAAGNSFKAIQLVSKALSDSGLTAEQTQKIIADVFGGPGEDAGLDYLKTLKDIKLNLQGVRDTIPPVQAAQFELNKSYNQFVLSVSDGSGVISKAWSDVLNSVTGFLNKLTEINTVQETTWEKSKRWVDVLLDTSPALKAVVDWTDKLITKFLSLSPAAADAYQKIKDFFSVKPVSNVDEAAIRKRVEAEYKAKKEAEKKAAEDKAKADKEAKTKLTEEQLKNAQKLAEEEAKRNAATAKRLGQLGIGFGSEGLNRQLTEEENKNLGILDSRQELAIGSIDILKNQLEEEARLKGEQIEKEREFELQKREIIGETLGVASEALGELLTNGELSLKEFGKFVLKTFLTVTENVIQLSLARLFAEEISSKSFAGLVTFPILAGLVKGFFAGIKSRIKNFAEGTEYVNGPGTEKSDSIPARLSKGERIVPAGINKQLLGISNRDLPKVINSGLQSLKMESLLNQINLNSQMTALYLSRGKNIDKDNKYTTYEHWGTGGITRKLND